MPRNCAFAGCSNTSTKDDVSFHLFPKNDKTRRQWIRNVRLTRHRWGGPSRHSTVCSAHFTGDMFTRWPGLQTLSDGTELRRDLIPGAVPTVFPRPTASSPATPSDTTSLTSRTSGDAKLKPTSASTPQASSRDKRMIIRQVNPINDPHIVCLFRYFAIKKILLIYSYLYAIV